MLRPSNSMVPAVGSSAASTSFDVVVLPHPDSPTSPSVSPGLMLKLIPSTALTTPCVLRRNEPPTGKSFRRSCTSSKGLCTPGGLGVEGHPAPHVAVAIQVELRRLLDPTAVHRLPAAGLKAAARRKGREIRRLARNAVERRPDTELRDRV